MDFKLVTREAGTERDDLPIWANLRGPHLGAAPRATRQGSAAIVLWMGGVRDSCGGAAFEAPAGAADAERESICSTARRWPMERASSSLATAALGRGRAADGAAAGVHSWRMYRA